jgi:hypothetical protein
MHSATAEDTAWLAFRVKSRSQVANFGVINRGYKGIGRIIDKTAAYLVHLLPVENIFYFVVLTWCFGYKLALISKLTCFRVSMNVLHNQIT